MKKFTLLALVFVFALSVIPAGFGLAAQKPSCPVPTGDFLLGRTFTRSISQRLTINPSSLSVFQGKLVLEGFEQTCDIGKPQIPYAPMRIQIPEGYAAQSVRIASCNFVKRPMPELNDYQPKIWQEQPLAELKNQTPTGLYPANLGNFKTESGMNGNFATIRINPIILDYDTKSMSIATELEIQVELESQASVKSFGSDDETMSKAIILTSSKLKTQADKLAKSQKDSGYQVEVVEIENLKGKYEPQKEEPEDRGPANFSKSDKEYMKNYDYDFVKRIRSYLLTQVGKIGYITILGDGTLVPPSFYYINGYTYMKVDRYVPSDLYYSSPDLDFVPDFAVGRLPVRNTQEAETVVSKIIDYRKALSADWFHSINLCGGDPFSGGFEGELACQSLVDDGLVDNFKVNKYYMTDKKFETEPMKKAFADEVGFVYVDSHGSGDAIITEPGKITSDDVMALPKRAKLPILVSVACLNGMYDADVVNYKLDKYPNSKGLSFGQACMVSPGGPIAYFGGTRLNYAGVNWSVESGVVKTEPFSEIDRCAKEVINAYHNWSDTLGQIMVNAFTKYTGSERGWFSSGKTTYCFVFFGDPTIKLPSTPEGSPHRQPEIEFKGCPMTKGMVSIPILSYIDANTINMKTDLKVGSLRVIDLDDDNKIVEKTEFKQVGEKQYSVTHKPKTKTLWHARIDLPNKSEVWFYYLGSANTDISITNKTTFYTRKPNEKLRFLIDVNNDGIKKVNNVEVSFLLDDKIVETRKIKSLDTFEYRPMTFFMDGMDISKHKIKFEVKADEKEQYPKDNTFEKDLNITNGDTAKAGIMISYLFNRSKADKIFNTEKYEEMTKQNSSVPAEIAKIGSDSYWDLVFGAKYENFKNLGVDTLIVASPGFGNPYSSTLVKALGEFQASGGTIVGLGCLGTSSNGPAYSTLAEAFGFSDQIDYDNEVCGQATVKIANKDHAVFSKLEGDTISINTAACNTPIEGTWESNAKGAQILAKSDDGKNIVAANTKHIFFSYLPKFETDKDMQLLFNLATYNLRPQPDASLTLEGMNSDPGRISVGQSAKLQVTVKNIGNTKLTGLDVDVEQLNASQKIDSLEKMSSKTIEFDIPSQTTPGILTYTATVKAEGDVNTADNKATLRIRVFETKVDQQSEKPFSDLSIKDGDILPDKPFVLSGATSPDSMVMAGGRITRSDGKGRFALYMTPAPSPLTITLKKADGSISKTDVNCIFLPVSSIGGTIGKKSIFANDKYTASTSYLGADTINQNTYINMTNTFGMLGLKFVKDGKNISFGNGSMNVSGQIDSSKATLSINSFSKEIDLEKPITEKDGSCFAPFTGLLKFGFGGDIHSDSQTYLLTFPKDTNNEPYTPISAQAKQQESSTNYPSETDYGKPSLISAGPVEGEVERVIDYWLGKELTIWTTRGLEVWTNDGKFVKCLGFPSTASDDLEASWSYLFHPRADYYERGSQSFVIFPDNSLVVKLDDIVCFYDSNWKLIKKEDFDDDGLTYSIPLQTGPNDTVVFTDSDGVYLKYDRSGKRIDKFSFLDSEKSILESPNSTQTLPNGNILVFSSASYWFSSGEWSLRLYDSTGTLLKEKENNPDEDSEEEDLFSMAPSYVVGDNDGTFWLITDDFDNVTIEHLDSSFNRIDKVTLDDGGLIARGGMSDIRVDSNGKFWTKGVMYLPNEKFASLLACGGKDFKLSTVIKQVAYDRTNITPYSLAFDLEGNLVCYTRDAMTRYSQLGAKIDNLIFKTKNDDVISYMDLLKTDSGYSSGILTGRDCYIIVIADKENNVIRTIPAITDEPVYIADYDTDMENNEIFMADSFSSTPIKAISTYLDDEKDPTEVEFKRQFGSRGTGNGKISSISSLEVYGSKLFVLDKLQSKVLVYDKTTGEFLYEFGGYGKAPGKLVTPYIMNIDGKGFVWILDTRNSRIAIFDHEGTFINNLGREALYTTPSSLEAYAQNPFDLLQPYDMAVKNGKIAIFEYAHDRVFIVSATESSTNLTIYPEKPILEGFSTEQTISTWFTVTNTGSGNLEAKITCENKNIKITGETIKNNAGLVKVSLDISKGEIPKSITLAVESSIGTGEIVIPVIIKQVNCSFVPGNLVARNASKLIRLSRAPAKIENSYTMSTKDFADLIPLSGTRAKDDSTVFYNFGTRQLGFEAGKNYATLMLGEDTFKVSLGMTVEKTKDGGLTVPIDVVASFLSCQLIVDGDMIRMVARQ
ncbi:MAG: 6-bladed beta-propeller [Caldisericia bacterium]|nr:6-bladed beta-propeller [Caldisericia bacterium]